MVKSACIEGERVVLAPYDPEHVPQYHEWMQDTEIQILTASEPLTLEEEYAMQRRWAEDPDKVTFIVLDRSRGGLELNALDMMAGDVNLFIDADDRTSAEVEVMIAEASSRRKVRGVGMNYVCAWEMERGDR
jgi:RimJ/RimL family protein N-acetyltransferase